MKYLIVILALAVIGFLAWYYIFKGEEKESDSDESNTDKPETNPASNSDWLFGNMTTPAMPKPHESANYTIADPEFLSGLNYYLNSIRP